MSQGECFGEKPDYSGTDRESWTLRCIDSHRQHALQHKNANAADEQKREFGCRFSVLIELPYYNIIRFCVINPMHNLLLGTAKHMFTVWSAMDLVNKSDCARIQEKVDSFVTPDIGCISNCIRF